MQEMLAAQVATADVVIQSSLLPEGVTVGATVTGISVAVTTNAPTQSPTPRPTSTALFSHVLLVHIIPTLQKFANLKFNWIMHGVLSENAQNETSQANIRFSEAETSS